MIVIRIGVGLCVLLTCGSLEARTWKPVDKPAFSGDFLDVEGDNVRIQTVSGIEVIPYQSLSRSDKAVVKSNLQSKGQRDVVSRLSQLDNGKKSESPRSEADETQQNETKTTDSSTAMPGTQQSGSRNWTDINGNQLQAEFVRVVGLNVELRVDGVTQTYPISGFGVADQQWLALKSQTEPGSELPQGPPNGAAMAPGSDDGGQYPGSSMPRSGIPGSGFPGRGSPGSGFSGPPIGAGMPGGYPSGPPGMMDPGRSMSGAGGFRRGGGTPFSGAPGYPDGGMGSQSSGMPQQPDYSGGGPAGFPGASSGFGSGHPSGPDSFGPPSMPPAFQPPSFPSGPPTGFSVFDNKLKCEHCGAEFPATSGLTEGDECPTCSGGSSSGGTGFRVSRGAIKGIVFLIAAVAGLVGWIVKKAAASA